MSHKKKLIEVAMPLDAINAASVREKSIRHGHPSTLHLWWARRPLASARAVIWASLVDDPSSHPELFPTEEAQSKERKRLFEILERLVKWENSNNPSVLEEAKQEILKSTDGNPPEFLDPFAGGGALPLEALRLGLKSHAHDLNPVAVMINKAMIEIPEDYSNRPPINPNSKREFDGTWTGFLGLSSDIKYYGEKLKTILIEKVGHFYPKVKLPDEEGGGDANVIAWLWAKTIQCPSPACGCEMPLISSNYLSKSKGNEYWVETEIKDKKCCFKVNKGIAPKDKETNKIGKGGTFKCPNCGTITQKSYIHDQFENRKDNYKLMAIVAEGKKRRIYLSPNYEMEQIALDCKPTWIPDIPMNTNCTDLVSGRGYGISQWDQLYTKRQLTFLSNFCDSLSEIYDEVLKDAICHVSKNEKEILEKDEINAAEYARAVCVYLTFVLDKMTDYNSASCSWHSSKQLIRNTFGRQAIPMVWDFAEANPFSDSTGSFSNMLDWVVNAVQNLPMGFKGEASQFPAQEDCGLRNIMVSTDPPYYDNIGYADLSDYFYVWMKRSLKRYYPDLFRTLLVPKADELIASHYRHKSREASKKFFEEGMEETCKQIRKYARNDIPVTIYYAYKQRDSDITGTASSGWETMLSAILNAGFIITGTWPMRTEMSNRQIASGTNALASSIVLVCRKKEENAPISTRRSFINELRKELQPALRKLQESNLAPVDMAQSAIGPGIAVFSKYNEVLEADGSHMSIRTALQLINKEIDNFFNEQDSDLDEITRFCIDLYKSYGFNEMQFGDADVLGKAKNISVERVKEAGCIKADKGYVSLTPRNEIKLSPHHENIWNLCQVLVNAMDTGGELAVADIVADQSQSKISTARDLVYRLYSTADKKGWNSEAYKYNSLINAWSSIDELSRKKRIDEGQMTLNFES